MYLDDVCQRRGVSCNFAANTDFPEAVILSNGTCLIPSDHNNTVRVNNRDNVYSDQDIFIPLIDLNTSQPIEIPLTTSQLETANPNIIAEILP